jgi:hypothetical protein
MWTPLAHNELIEAHGVFDSHFVYYKIPANSGAVVTLEVQPKDGVIGSADGKILPVVVSQDQKHFTFTLPSDAKELIVLHDKHGHQNGPKGMETGGTYGILSVEASNVAAVQFAVGGSLGKEREVGEGLSRAKLPAGDGWKSVPVRQNAAPAPEALLTWYRMRFELPSQKSGVWVPWLLRLEAYGNGFVYINGRCLGRYWQVGPQRNFYIPETWLNFGAGKTNTIALNLRPLDKGVCVQAAQIVPDTAFAEFR